MSVNVCSKRNYLLAYIEETGLLSAYTQEVQEELKTKKEGMLLNEAYAREIGERCLKSISSKIKVHQRGYYDRFDMDYVTGGTRVMVEIKCRNNSSDHYPDDRISYEKGDAIDKALGLLLVYYKEDGRFRIWDLRKYKPKRSSWIHNRYSSQTLFHNDRICEDNWVFEHNKAVYEGQI